MNWRIIRLIAGRELRDLLRDRRSLMLLLVLPVILYPGFGLAGYFFAIRMLDHPSKIGIVGFNNLPSAEKWVELSPDRNPPLIIDGRFAHLFCESKRESALLEIVPLDNNDQSSLDRRDVDVILIVPNDFSEKLYREEAVTLELKDRDGDEPSKLATRRLTAVLQRYDDALKKARFARHKLPIDFDQPLVIREPKADETPLQRGVDELRDRLAKFLPLLLVMWALAGALHPAIDVCAGEKERGTMETLLISPAERNEIVAGKFLAVWIFSTATAIWNLLWMGGLCLLGAWKFEIKLMSMTSLLLCMLLSLPITALFTALSIALGVYARSTKEGQYYLLPLFLIALPLITLSLMPNTELTFGTSLIPVTGACLLIQKMIGPAPASDYLPYIAPVMGSLAVCVVLSCIWAVRQFHREDVLFRESDGPTGQGWLSGFGSDAK